MLLELHNVTIGQQILGLSATACEGKVLCIKGSQGSGKTMLLRAILGFQPIDKGHISIDGELLTPLSAPYFRRQMAYVPQELTVPEDYVEVPTDYVQMVQRAVRSGKQILIVDEPRKALSAENVELVDSLIGEAVGRGATVVAVNSRFIQNLVQL